MKRIPYAVLIAILLLGAALRLQGLQTLATSLNYDEAYYAMDATSLLQQPRLTPFFVGNYGRESAWMYVLVPFLLLFGHSAFGLRLAAIFTGILTLAATYRLGREIYREHGPAIAAMTALAVLYWHVHFSHLVWRAVLFPLVGTLAFVLLWRARRTNDYRHWIGAGLFLAVLSYTYFAARVWLLLAAGMLLYGLLTEPAKRRGILLAAAIALAGSLPLIVFILTHNDLANQRIDDVAVSRAGDVLDNVRVWARLWFIEGPQQRNFNLPGRPILDVPLLFLSGIGLVGTFYAVREKSQSIWVLLLGLGSAMIALFTVAPENMIRMIGSVIPLALVSGAGAWMLYRGMARFLSPSMAVLIPSLLLLWAGIHTQHDYAKWLTSDLYLFFEQHLYDAADYLRSHTGETATIYFSPFAPTHPVLQFHAERLAPRRVSGFDATQCWVLPADGALYFSLTLFDADFAERLSQFATVETIHSTERYAIYDAVPHEAILNQGERWVFDEQVVVRLLHPLPETIPAGTTLDVLVTMESEVASMQDITLFMHLYGDPTPYEGGALWAQADQPICTSHPTRFWQADTFIVQPLQFTIPAQTPTGEYDIAIGLYETVALNRLSSGGESYRIVQSVQVIAEG